MTVHYDDMPPHASVLLDVPYREGTGVITQDVASPHHPLTLTDPGGGSFVRTSQGILEFVTIGGGATDGVYISCPQASCADLNFTNGSYSVGGWINWDGTGGWSEILIGRYGVDLDGWEIYLDLSGGLNTLSQRHHHASRTPDLQSSCFSTGWTPGTWYHFGVSRTGGDVYPKHYRNGVELTMSYSTGGLFDPDTCARDLVIGCRYTKDANWYKGLMGRIRVWGGKALTATEWKAIYEIEAAAHP